jgi:hypothetical protein
MKKILLLVVVVMALGVMNSQAQRLKAKIAFPNHIVVKAPGAPPFAGAIWIGPEWEWRGGKYVVVPGYWAKPRKEAWVPGHWVRERRQYRWVPGHWK